MTIDNLLIMKHPKLVKNEWDYDKNDNDGINVNTVTCGSHVKAWWHCHACDGSYLMEIRNKINGQKCPYCSGKKVLQGFNDLASQYPELIASDWDYANNNANNIRPDMLTKGSAVMAHWKCHVCKGSYVMAIYSRTNNRGCPYCAGQKVLFGFNDLASNYPELMKEWDLGRNNNNPSDFTIGSNKKAYWKCSVCNGQYEMRIVDRTLHTRGCPYCSGQKVLTGFNDLLSNYPQLVHSEWNYVKNSKKGLKPDEIMQHSKIKAWWRCSECSYEWFTSVGHRTLDDTGCPKCSRRVSKQEDKLAEFINYYICNNYVNMKYSMHRSIKFKKIYKMLNISSDVISDDLQSHLLKELDIYIPELNLAVEYDGDYWHSDAMMIKRCGLTNSEAHAIKNKLCEQAGIRLLFITEHDWLHDNENIKNMLTDIVDNHIK